MTNQLVKWKRSPRNEERGMLLRLVVLSLVIALAIVTTMSAVLSGVVNGLALLAVIFWLAAFHLAGKVERS